jgi:hypothetical protein
VTHARELRRLDPTVLWAFAALTFWGVMAFLGATMFAQTPRIAAFDLDLLVQAGRAVAAGQQPYDAALLAGTPPDATGLFYSYPPIVAQALVPIADLPLGAIAIAWSVVAITATGWVAVRIRDRMAIGTSTPTVFVGTIAVAAMTLPMAVAVLFGNLDAFFPALYGLVLVAAISPQVADGVLGGVALAIGGLTKVYPGALAVWFLVRWLRDRGAGADGARRWLTPLAACIVVAVVLVGLSVALFGIKPWQDYSTVAAAAARAELVDHRNDAPAAQLALWLGADSATSRLIHLPVLMLAALAIVGAAWRVSDPLASLAIAAVASLFVLPISWVHYPAVLIPFGVAAVLRVHDPDARRHVAALLSGALVVAVLALLWLPLLWLAIGIALIAIRRSTLVTSGTARDGIPSSGLRQRLVV